MELNVVVVMYNKTFADSETLESLNALSNYYKSLINLTVWNNGPKAVDILDSFDLTKYISFNLINDLDNPSLSTVYNKVFESNEADYYIVLDDDSKFGASYFESILENEGSEKGELLMVPVAVENQEVISPASSNLKRLNSIKPGIHRSKLFNIIGSGMVIPNKVFDKIKFNVDFHLYGVDSNYFWQYSCDYKHFLVLDSVFNHSISSNSIESKEIKEFRFRELTLSQVLQAKLKNGKLRTFFWLIKHTAKTWLSVRSLSVLRVFVNRLASLLLD